MKIKVLALAVTGILLSGCGNDDNGSYPTTPTPTLKVQAYDPAIQGMNATASCEDGTTETRTTDYYGNASFTGSTILSAPGTCKFTFVGGADAVDVSNGKSMNGVTYIIPEGLASKDAAAITATPISTLIAKTLGDDVAYDETTATQVMTDLGLDALVNNGDIDVTEFLLNTESVMKSLETKSAAAFSQLSATTAVLTDVLKTNSSIALTADEVEGITTASKSLTTDVLAANSSYPAGGTEGKGVYVSYDEAQLKKYVDDSVTAAENNTVVPALPPVALPDAEPKPEPKPDDKPATGGTGGTGADGSGSEDA